MYTLRFPFSLPPGREIHVTQESGELDGLTFLLKKQDRFYVFTIAGFPTEDAAKRYINNVWAGLMWVLLHRGLPPDAVFKPGKVVYQDDPYQAARNYGFKKPIDAFLDGGQPAVYPTEKRICIETAGQITPLQTYRAGDVLNFFREGVAFPESAEVINDAKLRVALELWGAYFTEASANARFLTLVMALETLATGIPRTQLVLGLLDKWKKEAEELGNSVEPESDDAISLDAVSRELLFRKVDSIRRQIQMLVFTTLQVNGDPDASEMAKSAVRTYDLRSRLVHEGKLESQELSKATADAKHIVERVLRAQFVHKVQKVKGSQGVKLNLPHFSFPDWLEGLLIITITKRRYS